MILKKIFIMCSLSFSTTIFPFHSMLTTGQFLESGEYKLLAETQFLTTVDSGVNLNAHGEAFLSEQFNLKATVGIGTTQFNLAGYIKWVPIPDFSDQPAIGLLSGIIFGQFDETNDFSLKFSPFISKKFELEIGDITPYASLSFGVRSFNDKTVTPLQLIIGGELLSFDLKHIRFFAEAGFDLSDSFSYFSLAASVDIDNISGFKFY